MTDNGNGASASRILTLDQVGRKDKDAQGRVLRHNATVLDVHQIVKDECDKIHQFYLKQIPNFVAHMLQDALIGYGLIQPVVAPKAEEAAPASPTDPPSHKAEGLGGGSLAGVDTSVELAGGAPSAQSDA